MVNTPPSGTNQGMTVTTTVSAPPPPKLKPLSQWARIGLDLSSAAFAKLQSKEASFDDNKTKYNLKSEKFEMYRQELIEKINRMHSESTFTIDDSGGNQCHVLKEYTKLVDSDVEYNRVLRWPGKGNIPNTLTTQEDYDKFTDEQIKASTVGSYINESLTDEAKKQLRADTAIFEVEDDSGCKHFDGPTYFWKIAEFVDPDNGHLVENAREQLHVLNVKDFGYSVIKMLAEFKNLRTRVSELGGDYSDDDQYLDFWRCLKTMQEKEFSRYVKQEKDAFRKLKKGARPKIEEYIKDMSQKEVSMRTDKEWNVMSPEDSMLLALVNSIDQSSKGKNKNNKNKKKKELEKEDTDKDGDKKKDPKKQRRSKDSRIPDWKKVPPKQSEKHEKVVEEKTYYWCKHCREGKGMWALHKESEHNHDYKAPSRNSKKVDFSKDTKTNDGPKIQVNKSLLKNAKAYLAKFEDFGEGGTSQG